MAGRKTSGQPIDPADEIIKAIIGSAVNIALPGVGSLAVGAFGALTARTLNQELARALAEAINIVDDSAEVPKFALVRRAKGRWRKRKINKALKSSVRFSDLQSTSVARFERAVREEGGEKPDTPKDAIEAGPALDEPGEQEDGLIHKLRGAALAQLSLSQTEGPVPGTWLDDFEDHLETLAGLGLADDGHAETWRSIITGGSSGDPSPALVEEWARLVSEAFSVQLANNTRLSPYLDRMIELDKRASERSFLWQLDRQRRAVNVLAFSVLAIAIEYGVHLAA